MSGTMSGGGDSSTTTITPSQTAGFNVSHTINENGTGFNPSPMTIALYAGIAFLAVFIILKLFRR